MTNEGNPHTSPKGRANGGTKRLKLGEEMKVRHHTWQKAPSTLEKKAGGAAAVEFQKSDEKNLSLKGSGLERIKRRHKKVKRPWRELGRGKGGKQEKERPRDGVAVGIVAV